MPKIPKLKKKELYRLKFRDHCTGDVDGVLIDFVGFYIEENEHFYIFSSWLVDSEDEKLVRDNLEKVSVIKAAVIYLRRIKNQGLLQ